MKTLMRAKQFIMKHRFISFLSVAGIIIGIFLGYRGLQTTEAQTRYVTDSVERGVLITTVSGSGVVSTSNQIDVTPKVSGDVVSVKAVVGMEVISGTVLAQLDTSDARRDVNDAQTALETAELELEDLLKPPTELEITQAENALSGTMRSLERARDDFAQISIDNDRDLARGYEDAFKEISDAYVDIPDHIRNLADSLGNEQNQQEYVFDYKKLLGDNSIFISRLIDDEKSAADIFDKEFAEFRVITRDADNEAIVALLDNTIVVATAVSRGLESARALFDAIVTKGYSDKNIASLVDTMRPKIQSDIGEINAILTSLQNTSDTLDDLARDLPVNLKNAQADIDAVEEQLAERELSLRQLLEGPDELDIRSRRVVIQQRRDALVAAQQALANHTVRAPFDGVIVSVDITAGQSVSASSNVATLITKTQLAEIALNEIDAVKVEQGQKATITFDAIDDLGVTGEILEIDPIGTVTQGVVNFDVVVGFDIQDERVRPGMSASVSIITQSKAGVLIVPNAAVKSQGETQYVELLENGVPRRQTIQAGLSNELVSEVIDGVSEGDLVVTQTIVTENGSGAQGGQQTTSGILPGGSGFGGGRSRF